MPSTLNFLEMQYQRVAIGFLRKLFVILLVCIPAFAFAQQEEIQEEDSGIYITADLASKCLWRGMGSGDAPLVMPTVGFCKGGFDVFAWGAWAFDDSYREVNVGVSYSFSNFTLEVIDYFYPYAGSDFFNFRNRSTTHTAEAILTYAPEVFPIHVMVGTYIFGDDKLENGKNAFSTYAEVGYTYDFKERNSVHAEIGATLNRSFYTEYEKRFGIVNITAGYTRTFTLWNYDLPVSADFSYNPCMDEFYWAVKFNFNIL